MTRTKSNEAIIISSLVVAGIYVYRRATEPAPQNGPAAGLSVRQMAQPFTGEEVPPAGRFITGWGFTYLIISIMGAASPALGGWFSILVATGAVLGNGVHVANDVEGALGKPPQKQTPKKGKKNG